MENPRKNSRNQDKKKMAIKIGGGGVNVGGVILLGGALAAATFLGSAFAIKTRRRQSSDKNSNNHQPPSPSPAAEVPIDPLSELNLEKNDNNEITKGLPFILPDSSSNETAKMDVAQIESESPISTQNLILDEKPKLESNGDDKIILCSIIPKEPEISPLFDESAISKEEFSFPVLNNQSSVTLEDVNDNESSQEIEVITNSSVAIEEDNSDQITVEDIPQRPILGNEEEEKACESDGKFIAEKGKDEVDAASVQVETQLIEEKESPVNENQEEKECETDGKIIVAKGEDGVEAFNVEGETLLIEERESPANNNQVEKECESDGKIVVVKVEDGVEAANAEVETQLIEEQESPTKDYQEVEKECEIDGKIVVQKGEDGVEAANAAVERQLIEEQESPTNGDQEIICSIEASEVKPPQNCSFPVFDNPTNYGDHLVIEEETPQMESNEEQESPRTGDQEVICSDSSIPRTNMCEVKKEECLMAVFDSPTAFEPENLSSKEEDEDRAVVEDTPQLQSAEEEEKEDEYVAEIIVEKCVVDERSHSDEVSLEDDGKIQASEVDQEALVNQENFVADNNPIAESCSLENSVIKVDEFCSTVAEIIEQVDSTEASLIIEAVKEMTEEDEAIESACGDKIAVEDNPPMQLMEEEEKEDNDGRYIAVEADTAAVTDNPQMQLTEEEEGEDDNKGRDIIDDADDEEETGDTDDEEETGDTDDEDTCEKAEESSEGTGDSSMESNAEPIWPAEESMQEFSMKFKESKIINNNPGEKTEENGKFYGDGYEINEEKGKLTMPFKTAVATQNVQRVDSWKLRVWIVSILVPLVLVLLLLDRPTLFEALFNQEPL